MTATFEAIRDYGWADDAVFQAGLGTILQSASASDPVVVERLTRRAQCYYFARKNLVTVDVGTYEAWIAALDGTTTAGPINGDTHVSGASEQDTPASTTTPPDSRLAGPPPISTSGATPQATAQSGTADTAFSNPYGDAPTPASFADICRMISDGVPVPGIKEIPDTVLEGQSSASSAPRRRKPWEMGPPSSTSNEAAALGTADADAAVGGDVNGASRPDEIPAWQASAT